MPSALVEDIEPVDPHAAIAAPGGSWFVYLFALMDCSAFKVGFSCNPLQRIYSFSHRYFEYFDLHQSVLLPLEDCGSARAIEAALKKEFAEFRAACPGWVPTAAGGQTEWFSAVYFRPAEQRLRSFLQQDAASQLLRAADHFQDELGRLASSFELWAWSQAQQLSDIRSTKDWRGREQALGSLRDWLDAYRYFDIALFTDDPAVREFMSGALRAAPR
jgi:hypothetical protein